MTTNRRRTVFDLTPQELRELYRLNQNVSATVAPRRPRIAPSYSNYQDRDFDEGIYARYHEMHALAKAQRSDWLRMHRITRNVMLQAVTTNYNPYAKADRLGLVAPPEPEGYAEAQRAWRAPKTQPASVPQGKGTTDCEVMSI